jgi:hypothetical protein
MVSRPQELAHSQEQNNRGRFASSRIPPPLPTSSGSSSLLALIQVWVTPPTAKRKEEIIMEVDDDSSPFEWMLLESEDYSHDPHMMRVSY